MALSVTQREGGAKPPRRRLCRDMLGSEQAFQTFADLTWTGFAGLGHFD